MEIVDAKKIQAILHSLILILNLEITYLMEKSLKMK